MSPNDFGGLTSLSSVLRTALMVLAQDSLPHARLFGRSGRRLEKLWREFFSDPSQWWDNRSEKASRKYPDFKHKKTQQPLWLDNKLTPAWVEAKLAALAPGTLQNDIFSWDARLQRFVKEGHYEKTLELFEQMQREGMHPHRFTFVPVLNACSSLQALAEGKRVHLQIIRGGFQCDVYVGNSLVDMYAKCGSIERARSVFNQMTRRDVVSYNALILGHVKYGQGAEALALFQQMQREGCDIDTVTFVGVLNACASIGAIEEGRHAHEQIINRGYESDGYVGSALVDMYAKCGSIEDARRVFDKMTARNVVCWGAMLAGYCRYGFAKEALAHFERMCQEVKVNGVSFVSLLSACSHGGLVDEGRHYFDSITAVYSIPSTLEHYACAIDILGRAGHLHEAEDLIRRMPYEPDAIVLLSLLGACRSHRNLEIGERIAKELQVLDPGNDAGHLLLSNICTSMGKG